MKKFLSSLLFIFATICALPAFATLPAGYTELEYIESTGTQWIDTGHVQQDTTGIKIVIDDVSKTSPKANIAAYYVGTETSTKYMGYFTNYNSNNLNFASIWAWNGEGVLGYNIQSTRSTVYINYKNDRRYVYNNGVRDYIRNNNLPTLESGGMSLYLFAAHQRRGGADYLAAGKIYSVEITEGTEIVHKFVPAKNSSNVIGMYDVMDNNPSTAFHTNQGTGTFIAGPAKCRNLFDGVYPNVTTAKQYRSIYVGPGTYTASYDMPAQAASASMVYFLANQVTSGANNTVNQVDATHSRTVTSTDGYVTIMYRLGDDISMSGAQPSDYHLQIEAGSVATDYVPYCEPGIKIATTAYNAAAFAPVEAALESAVTTIKDVVANTIVQADAIQNLQDTKQTMPDANGTNGTCPRFRQCLLIETDDGTPQWFQIADPVHDLVLSLKNNKVNSSGETTNNTFAANGKTDPDARYYKGYPAMRLQTNDATATVQSRQFADANLSGGQYKTLGDQEWAVTWDGNETGTADSFLPGVIYGTSRCAKTKPASTLPDTTGWTTIENSDALNDLEHIEEYEYCYCKVTGVGLDGTITPVRDSSLAPWGFVPAYSTAGVCAGYCAYNCATYVRDNVNIRQAVMGWAVE